MEDDERRTALRSFLLERRADLQPADVGLASIGRRRAIGLRRDEVAALAGVSVTWYTWFETAHPRKRFSLKFVSAVAQALRLDGTQRAHLFSLAFPEVTFERPPAGSGSVERLARDVALAPTYSDVETTALSTLLDALRPAGPSFILTPGRPAWHFSRVWGTHSAVLAGQYVPPFAPGPKGLFAGRVSHVRFPLGRTGAAHLGSILNAPLNCEGTLLGAIGVVDVLAREFSHPEQSIAVAIAAILGDAHARFSRSS